MPVISVDFDGTICGSDKDWPAIGTPIPDAIETLQALHAAGFCLIINTCRIGLAHHHMLEYLRDNKIPYCRVNANCERRIRLYGGDCRKISADCYIDDKNIEALRFGVNWKDIKMHLHVLYGVKSHNPMCEYRA